MLYFKKNLINFLNWNSVTLLISYFIFIDLQSVADSRGAELHYLPDEFNIRRIKNLYYKGKTNHNIVMEGVQEEKNNEIICFDDLNLSDKDELNAHLAFTALCLLKEKEKELSDKKENENNFYSVFSTIDLMSSNVQNSLQRRPPCRWEVHTVRSTILVSEESDIISSANASNATSVNDMNDIRQSNTRNQISDEVEVEVVLDVGHNPAAMEALSKRIQEQYPGRSVRYVRCRAIRIMNIRTIRNELTEKERLIEIVRVRERDSKRQSHTEDINEPHFY